jgi:opacity protein-like surface antigen
MTAAVQRVPRAAVARGREMFKLSSSALVICAGTVTAIPTAMAADMPQPIPIAVHGWYLRGDIGYSNQQVDSLDNALYATYDSVDNVYKDFDGAPFLGAGIGYRWNRWFRTDITGEYRSKSDFDGLDIGTVGGVQIPDNYSAKKSEWLALVNGYLDLGTWHGITPFVGAGVGAANVKISDFTDIGVTVDSVAFGEDHDEWNFAWGLYGGLAFEVTEAFTVELAYRYLDLGDAQSGDLIGFDGTNLIDNPMVSEDLTSHDIKLGVRYTFW